MKKVALGFITGVVGLFALISNMTPEDISEWKKGVVDKFEYLLMGYNTHKIPPYRASYYTDRRNKYTRHYHPYRPDDWD